jgi:hypothetical protein
LKVHRYFFNRGSKSRNKVAVGEPAAGSFSDDQKTKQNPTRLCSVVIHFTRCYNTTNPKNPNCRSRVQKRVIALCLFEHGFHNVSRWMTWLPISLKNAAKCDKWYQLQNHSITESLNANGAREKPLTAIPVHAVSLSVEQKPNSTKEPWLVSISLLHTRVWSRLRCGQVVTPNTPSNRRFMGNSIILFCRLCWKVCWQQHSLLTNGKSTSGNTSLTKNI